MQPATHPLMPNPVMAEAADATKRKLFRAAMQGQWETVIAIYTDNTYVQAEKITRSEDTVLHVAVSDGKKDVVKQLVDAVAPHDAHRILEQQNEKGNTPLHLAAALGMVEVCAAMAKKCPILTVDARNKKGETPLFLAAKYGKKYAFFALQDAIESTPGIYNPQDISYCRRQDGNNILHVAISAEHFELALEIIYLYERLVNFNNERGETALHCLANKPDVFKSGSRFDLLDNLIYSYTFVTPMTVEYARFKGKIHTDGLELKDGSEKLPEKYKTCVHAFILLRRRILPLWRALEVRKKKTKHVYANQIMDKLVTCSLNWEFYKDGKRPEKTSYMASAVSLRRDTPPDYDLGNSPEFNHINSSMRGGDPNATPILKAAEQGITEMMEKILDTFPVAVLDTDSNNKNIILLAVEHRQLEVLKLLMLRKEFTEDVLGNVDNEGNSALHLAAKFGRSQTLLKPGAAIHMQWEIKWFKFIKKKLRPGFFPHYNNKGQTARDIFTETHESLAQENCTWLSNTAQSCSVVAALIAGVAFASASASTIPGGFNGTSGIPIRETERAFKTFAISALLALCYSATSLVTFLSFITVRNEERDFEYLIPLKLILGLNSLFMSIVAMLVSFCAAYYMMVKDILNIVTLPICSLVSLPVFYFVFMQFPLYIKLVRTTFSPTPAWMLKPHAF